MIHSLCPSSFLVAMHLVFQMELATFNELSSGPIAYLVFDFFQEQLPT